MPYGFPSGILLRSSLIRIDPQYIKGEADVISKVAQSPPHPLQIPSDDDVRRRRDDLDKLNIIKGLVFRSLKSRLDHHSDDHVNDEITLFANSFKYSGTKSIDAFLSYRSEYVDVGKRAIAGAVLYHESKATLEEWDWYGELWSRLANHVNKADGCWAFSEPPINIITFNYDRSLEYYLSNSIKHTFGLNEETAFRLVSELDIIHFYGSLGPLTGNGSIPFGSEDIGESYKNLKVIPYERVGDNEVQVDYEQNKARGLVSSKKSGIVYLGFGYDEMNCSLLGVDNMASMGGIYGTTVGLTPFEKRGIGKRYLGIKGGDNLQAFSEEEYTCMDLIRNKPVVGLARSKTKCNT